MVCLGSSRVSNGAHFSGHAVFQCLSIPFQCIPERVGLAATTWAIFADRNINPFDNAATTVCCNGRVPNLLGTAGGMGKTQIAIEFAYRYLTD